MAQSFLDMPGLPLGLRNNNPGNLRPLSGGQRWQGEIDPDLVNGFSRFQDVGYGLRAMITDITGDIVLDGQNTIRKLVNVYAPASENDTQAYINSVSSYTGIGPDTLLTADWQTIQELIKAKMRVELGATNAAKISAGDISEAFSRLSAQVKAWLGTPAGVATSSGLILIAAAAMIYFAARKR
jgi:hypothetical protein